MTIAILLGVLIGALLGLTGAGGGLLAVPALVQSFGWSMQQAGAVSLIAVSISAAIGAWDGYRNRLLRWRGALLMAGVGIPMTWVGAYFAAQFSQTTLQAIFAVAMIVAAVRMLYQATPDKLSEGELDVGRLATVCEKTGRFQWNTATTLILAGIGAITGALTGLLGVGGGFIMVPLLRRFSNVSMHGIVATSLSVIALVGTFGVIGSFARGITLPMLPTALFTASCIAGMFLGRKLAQHLAAQTIQKSFAALLLIVAAWLIWQVI